MLLDNKLVSDAFSRSNALDPGKWKCNNIRPQKGNRLWHKQPMMWQVSWQNLMACHLEMLHCDAVSGCQS